MFILPIILLPLFLYMVPAQAHIWSHEKFHRNIARQAPKDFRDYHNVLRRDSNASGGVYGSGAALATGGATSYQNYTYSGSLKATTTTASPVVIPAATVTTTSSISGAITVTTTVPAYQVCDTASSSCYTVFATQTSAVCSTTLTGFFTQVAITDCDQSVTFSTKSSFYLVATTPSASLAARQALTTRIQSVVSYYVAPWQSIAANTPKDITVVVCTINDDGTQTCSNIQEVWAVHTTYLPVTSTQTLTVSQLFTKNALLVVNNKAMTVNSGSQQFSTIVIYTTVIAVAATSVSQVSASAKALTTRTTTMHSTVRINVAHVTVTANQAAVGLTSSSSSVEPTTTITLYTEVTLTVTVGKSSSTITSAFYNNSTSIST